MLSAAANTSAAACNMGCGCVVVSGKSLGKEKVPPDEVMSTLKCLVWLALQQFKA